MDNNNDETIVVHGTASLRVKCAACGEYADAADCACYQGRDHWRFTYICADCMDQE